ncbi:hypothetical protein TNCT_284681 [Trichonephila clavata]|uniref:Uncharacterized protein n=1 Tax=Trichonephila clavata TaxID=2740835 RepID=A0A8X6KZK2_TRICU|nr:hypothetical protein TNCT_284681 [Trichonephila clavata]
MLGFKRKSYNVISNSDTEAEEETEHQSSPKISNPESSEQEGTFNNSNSSVKVIWERKAVPREDLGSSLYLDSHASHCSDVVVLDLTAEKEYPSTPLEVASTPNCNHLLNCDCTSSRHVG